MFFLKYDTKPPKSHLGKWAVKILMTSGVAGWVETLTQYNHFNKSTSFLSWTWMYRAKGARDISFTTAKDWVSHLATGL